MIYLFTHTDLDGVACGILGRMFANTKKKNIQIWYCDYSDVDQKVNNFLDSMRKVPCGDERNLIFITDISVTTETADRLEAFRTGRTDFIVKLYDHHQLKPELLDYPWVYCNTASDTCGAAEFYRAIRLDLASFPSPIVAVEQFVDDVCLYDTWRFEKDLLSNSEALNMLLYLMGRVGFTEWVLDWMVACPRTPLIVANTDMYCLVQNDLANRKEYAALRETNMKRMSYKEYQVGVVFAERYISFVGDYILTAHPELDFVAIINLPKSVSLRSRKDNVNLGVDIARPLGGGGHPKAAGYEINELGEATIRQLLGWL